MLKQLQAVKMELRRRMHDPIAKTGAWLNQMLKGYLNYYAVSGNSPSLWWYFNDVRWRWLKSLKRRSQRAFMSWKKFTSVTDPFFPSQNPREEPGALAAHAGIWCSEASCHSSG
jgi:RNA-directed DNA polymerase